MGRGTFWEYTLHGEIEKSPEPVLFDYEEVKNFFRAVDKLEYKENCYLPYPRFQSKLKCMIAPAIFRLIYSTGMRPTVLKHVTYDYVKLHHSLACTQPSVQARQSVRLSQRHYAEFLRNGVEMQNSKIWLNNTLSAA